MSLIVGTTLLVCVAILLSALAVVGGRKAWPRTVQAPLLALALAAFAAPAFYWSWQHNHGDPMGQTNVERILAQNYNGKYGGLTIPHRFGEGKSRLNPPDIPEAGGYIRELALTPDGAQVASFAIYTLQGQRLEFLVRPEIVPINSELWNVERFEIYSLCRCMVALHFTRQPVGNVAIIMFAVEDVMFE